MIFQSRFWKKYYCQNDLWISLFKTILEEVMTKIETFNKNRTGNRTIPSINETLYSFIITYSFE